MEGWKNTIFALALCALVSCSSNTKITESSSPLYSIIVGDKCGFINDEGRIIIEPQFDDVYTIFSDEVCYAIVGERKGLIDRTGDFIVDYPDSVLSVSDITKGLAKVECGPKKVGIIDKNGSFIIPADHYDVKINVDCENLYLCVEGYHDEGDWFMTNGNGEVIGSPCDSIVSGFHNGLCAVKLNGKWGYMDESGKLVIDTVYNHVRVFSEDGLARVVKNGNHYYINKQGECVIKVDKAVSGFHCNRAAAVIGDNLCLIDKTGKTICNINADYLDSFGQEDHLATIIKDGKASKIDTMGNIVLSTQFENIGHFIGGVAQVTKDNKKGYIDIDGNVIISVSYSNYIVPLNSKNSRIRAVQNWENGERIRSYFDLHGKLIWKDIPSRVAHFPENGSKKAFMDFFDARLSELDPIEGIYYITDKNYYQSRENPSVVGLNDTNSQFYAIVNNESGGGFYVYSVDEPRIRWVNKFVKIGESNSYAVLKIDKENDFSSEGRITIEDYSQFDFKLDRGHNNWYNFFVTYEYIRDYPSLTDIEKIMKAEWTGSGFAISDGYLVTNYHVTSGAKSIRVKGINGDWGKVYSGYVVASDKDHDLSIVKVVDKNFDSFGPIPYTVGKAMVDVGDDVFVLGYPMTSTMGEEVKLTEGIISSSTGFKGDESMYQISAAVQPGNSGGPVFNSDGSVIGIVCGKHTDAENVNYAIKASYLYSLVASSDLGIKVADNNHISGKSLSKKVKRVKNYVYLIECSSR